MTDNDSTVDELLLAYQQAIAETEEAVRVVLAARVRENAAYRAWREAVNK